MRKLRWLLLLFAFFAFTATAAAKTTHYFPTGRACRAGYVRRIVRVAERKHGRLVRKHGHVVYRRRLECVAKRNVAKPVTVTTPTVGTTEPATTITPAVPTTPPTIRYSANVDPVATQNPTSPLQTSIAYSADATSTVNGVTTDLASTGNLPIGVLNLYSTTSAAAGSELICSMNVGGSTTGGTCNITYPSLGTYFLTTQYIVSATNSVTSTESITIDPMPSTATATVGSAVPFNYTQWDTTQWPAVDLGTFAGYNIPVNDASSDPNSPGVTATLTDTTTGATFPLGTYPVGDTIKVGVFTSDISGTNQQEIPAGDIEVMGSDIAATDVLTVSVVSEADYANGYQPSGPSNTVQVWPVS